MLLNGLDVSFDESVVWELEEGKRLPQWMRVDLNLTLLYEQNITTGDFLENRVRMFDYSGNKPSRTLVSQNQMIDPATGVRLDVGAFNYPEEESFNTRLSKLDIFKNIT